VDKKIGVLSGGEKSRVALAKLLLRPVNLLVLDEPTNHLDIASCEVLEEALQRYTGTLVFVSHDRAFINALATRVIDVKHGVLHDYPGDYDEYLDHVARLERREADAVAASAAEEVDEAATPDVAPVTRDATPAPPAARSKAERQADRQRRKSRDRIARRIERIEEEIHAHEQSLTQLDWRLGDPTVYADPERVVEVQSEQARIRETVDGLYAEWEQKSDELAALDDLLAD